jgi:hypothetical protein
MMGSRQMLRRFAAPAIMAAMATASDGSPTAPPKIPDSVPISEVRITGLPASCTRVNGAAQGRERS